MVITLETKHAGESTLQQALLPAGPLPRQHPGAGQARHPNRSEHSPHWVAPVEQTMD